MFYCSVWKTDRRRHHVPIIDLIGCRCSQKSCAGIDMFRLSLPRDREREEARTNTRRQSCVIGRQTATAKKTNISSTANAPPIFCRPWMSKAKRKPRFYAIGTPRPSHKSGALRGSAQHASCTTTTSSITSGARTTRRTR